MCQGWLCPWCFLFFPICPLGVEVYQAFAEDRRSCEQSSSAGLFEAPTPVPQCLSACFASVETSWAFFQKGVKAFFCSLCAPFFFSKDHHVHPRWGHFLFSPTVSISCDETDFLLTSTLCLFILCQEHFVFKFACPNKGLIVFYCFHTYLCISASGPGFQPSIRLWVFQYLSEGFSPSLPEKEKRLWLYFRSADCGSCDKTSQVIHC